MPIDEIGEELAVWGKVVRLGTRGRMSGERVWTAIGFVECSDGTVAVAAGAPSSDWALNLRADARCELQLEGRSSPCHAQELDEADRNEAIVALILKYGTPAERLGRGPAFRLIRDSQMSVA